MLPLVDDLPIKIMNTHTHPFKLRTHAMNGSTVNASMPSGVRRLARIAKWQGDDVALFDSLMFKWSLSLDLISHQPGNPVNMLKIPPSHE